MRPNRPQIGLQAACHSSSVCPPCFELSGSLFSNVSRIRNLVQATVDRMSQCIPTSYPKRKSTSLVREAPARSVGEAFREKRNWLGEQLRYDAPPAVLPLYETEQHGTTPRFLSHQRSADKPINRSGSGPRHDRRGDQAATFAPRTGARWQLASHDKDLRILRSTRLGEWVLLHCCPTVRQLIATCRSSLARRHRDERGLGAAG